jgi:cell division protein FtsL
MYFLVLTIPVFLGGLVRQSYKYDELKDTTNRLEKEQEDWVSKNRRLIADIALLSSSERIEQIVSSRLHLVKKQPEEVLQIRITGKGKLDG